MKARKFCVLNLLSCVAMAAVFAPLSSAAAQEIKIGAIISVTGPAALLGDPEEKTLKAFVEEINQSGGLNGAKLKLIAYDDGGDASKARTFATRLTDEDKVVAVIGGTATGPTMAMAPVFDEAGVPFISLAGAVSIIEPVRKFVFKTPQTDRMACERIFDDMKKRGFTKIVMISGTDGFGKSMRDECVKLNAKYGVEILGEETYAPRDSDMTAQLTNLKAKTGAQALLNPGFGQGPAIVLRNMKQIGFVVPIYESHGVASKNFIELAGDAAEGARLPATALLAPEKLPDSDPQKSISMSYKASFEKMTGQPVSVFGGYARDAAMILTQAIQRAKSSDPAKIRDEIEKTAKLVGVTGTYTLSPTDHMGLTLDSFRMIEIRNKDWVVLD